MPWLGGWLERFEKVREVESSSRRGPESWTFQRTSRRGHCCLCGLWAQEEQGTDLMHKGCSDVSENSASSVSVVNSKDSAMLTLCFWNMLITHIMRLLMCFLWCPHASRNFSCCDSLQPTSQKDSSSVIIFHPSCSSYFQELTVRFLGGPVVSQSQQVGPPATRQTWFLAGRLTPSASQSLQQRKTSNIGIDRHCSENLASWASLRKCLCQVARTEWKQRLQSRGSQSTLWHAVKIVNFDFQKRITYSLKTQFSPKIVSWKWL